ncbi:MAG: site-2 protease family protein [Coriobacteriales bacterium]|nr:site-2 protease family protein [Coriobacteriales bacterium]
MNTQLIISIVSIVCFVPAIVVHEAAHGFMAHRLGDPTAKAQGRITLNPLKHLDPFGTVLLPILLAISGMPVFGYAKPVPYNPRYFKNIKVGEVLTGLAGPAANLLMALLGAVTALILSVTIDFSALEGYARVIYGTAQGLDWLGVALTMFVLINLYLMFFNLIPIPPLDGSSVIMPLLPHKALPTWYQVQRYALPILMIVVIVLPMLIGFNPLGIYLNATAGNLAQLLLS